MSPATDIADWASASPIIDGVLFAPPGTEAEDAPVCAVAVARGFRGYGKGLKQSDALASAVGEAVERWAASRVDREKLVHASFREVRRELGNEAFDPRWLCLYSAEQYRLPHFPYRPFDENRPLHWIAGRWLDTGEPVYLPAFATYLTDEFVPEALCQTTSNGLAAGLSVEDAARRASLELYERDAFLTSWIALEGAVRVGIREVEAGIADVAACIESQGALLETYLLATGSPVFVAVSVGLGHGDRWPAVTLGLGAAGNCCEAIGKAILEHGQTGPYFARAWRSKKTPIPATPEQILTLEDHALYYCDPSHRVQFDCWRDRANALEPGAHHESGRTDDVRIAVADLTPPELESSPFRVVRALARGLQPIYCGPAFERLPTPRLRALLAGRMPNPAPPPIC
jgi:ribosomal protein S12 methylthiotransferase accessory factor